MTKADHSRLKAVFFDLDGTLLDTLEDIAGACNHALTAHGFATHPARAYARMVGNGFPRTVWLALPPDARENLAPAALDAVVTEARQWYAEHLWVHTRPYACMTQALHTLAAAGMVLAVLSNKPDALTGALIGHFFGDVPFVQVRGARPDAPLKPDPAVVLAMLATLGLAPEQCAYAGDTAVDVATARNAGMLSVGATWGFRGADELREAGAHLLASSPLELPTLLLPGGNDAATDHHH